MRILLIHQYFLERGDGGGSRFNQMTVQWAQAGHRVTVLAGMVHYNTGLKPGKYKGLYYYHEQYAKGVEVLRCHVSEAYNKGFGGRMWGYFSFVFSSVWGAASRLNAKEYDVVLCTSPPLFVGITGVLLSLRYQVPMVFEIRDLWPESAIDTGVLTSKPIIKMALAFEAFIYRAARKINVLTPAFKKVLLERKGVKADKIIYIPNAADFSLSDKVEATFNRATFRQCQGWSEGELVALYVGAHGVANHLEQLLDAAELLRDKPIRLVLIGAGMRREALLEMVQMRGLSNQVQMLPPVSKEAVFEYILGADVGMSVLKNVDTFKTVYSNKTFDYMACRRPILMAIDGVSRELVEEADAGRYAEPENALAIADVLLHYLHHPEERKRQGESGHRFAAERFDREKLAMIYLEEMQKVH